MSKPGFDSPSGPPISLEEQLEAAHQENRDLADALAAEHQQRLGDVESWTHWRNKYEEDTYALKAEVEQRTQELAEARAEIEELREAAQRVDDWFQGFVAMYGPDSITSDGAAALDYLAALLQRKGTEGTTDE